MHIYCQADTGLVDCTVGVRTKKASSVIEDGAECRCTPASGGVVEESRAMF